MSTVFCDQQKINFIGGILQGMEQSVLTLLSELPGLQAAQKALGERIDYIQRVAMGQERVPTDGGRGSGTAQAMPAPRKAPVSKAKLLALAKARAAKAQNRATATGNQAGKKAGTKNGGKRKVAKKRTQTVAAAGA